MPLDHSFRSSSQKPPSNSTFSRAQPAMLLQQLSRDPVQREEQLGVLLQDRSAGPLPAWLLAHTNPALAAAAGALRARPAGDYGSPQASPSFPLPLGPSDNLGVHQVLFRPTAIRAPPTSAADSAPADEPALRDELAAEAQQGRKRRFSRMAPEEEEVNSRHRKAPLNSPPCAPSKRPAFTHAADPVASRSPPNEEASEALGAPFSAQQPPAVTLAERLARYDNLTVSLRSSLPHGNLCKWDVAVARLRERVAQKAEFGSNVNRFLVFLHSQLRGAQQPSARAALHQFAALMRAKCQQTQEQPGDGNEGGSNKEGLGAVECEMGPGQERSLELQWLLR